MEPRQLSRLRLATTSDMILEDITTPVGTSAWSPLALDEGYALILVRAGGFWREAQGVQRFIDAGGGYLSHDGVEERFASPLRRGDVVTLVGMTEQAYDEQVAGVERCHGWHLSTTARFDLRHRELLAAARRGIDRFEAQERLVILLESLPPRTNCLAGPSPRPATAAEHRRLVSAARQALSDGHLSASLDELARLAGSSPHHLSRIFRRLTGRTITAYRNDLRVRAVLEELAAGAPDLSALAAAYGFADHAHLTRTVRRYAADTPAAIRRRLSATSAG